jgi:hypothetical protein
MPIYPDPPGPRIGYDIDGTVVVCANEAWTQQVQLTEVQKATMNREAAWHAVSNVSGWMNMHFIFPALMDINAITLSYSGWSMQVGALSWSADTTNGQDGIWTTGPTPTNRALTKAAARTLWDNLSLTGVRAVRQRVYTEHSGTNSWSLHLYGTPTAADTNQPALWHPTLDQRLPVSTLNLDARQSDSADITFRVKNPGTLTAQNVTLSADSLIVASPTIQSFFTFANGGAFASTLNVGDLAPGAVSGVVTMRRAIAADAVLGLWWPRVRITPTGWV